jgi:predicted  nucleic acid-binding Zn-ribbon protein
MPSSRNVDVSLVIRAQDEATKALDTIGNAMENLLGKQNSLGSSADATGSNVADLIKTLATLDKAAGSVAASYGKADAAFNRQQASIDANREKLAALQQQAEHAAGGYDVLQRAIVDASLAGKDTSKLVAALAALGQEQARYQQQAARLTSTIAAQAEGIESSRAPLQRLGSSLLAVGDAQAQARSKIDATTAAIERQNAASAKAAGVAPTIERAVGSSRAPATSNGATFSALNGAAEAQELREAAQAYDAFEARVRAGVAAMKEADAAEKQLATDTQAEARRQAAAAWQLFEAKVRSGVAAMKEADAAERDDAAAAADLRAKLDPVAAIYERMNVQLERYSKLQAAGKITAGELGAAQVKLAEEAKQAAAALQSHDTNAPKVSILGLQPYQTQNLFYQLNDVVTQLSSGTSLSQTLAQQGGQIFQLFQNRVGPAIRAALTNPAVLAGIASFGVLVLALKEAANQAELLRSLTSTISLNANGGIYDAAALTASAEALRRYGIAAGDAASAFKVFIADGIQPEKFDELTIAAQNTADVLGNKLADAAKQVGDAFSGGYDAIVKLDDATNFLTGSQRDNIRSLYEQGQAAQARSLALDIYNQKQAKAAADARGPWTDAVRSLSGAWQGFVNFLANSTVIQAFASAIGGLADNVTRLFDAIHNGDSKGTLVGLLSVTPVPGAGLLASAAQAVLPDAKPQGTGIAPGPLLTGKANPFNKNPSGDTIATGPDSPAGKAASQAIAAINLQTELNTLQEKGAQGLSRADTARRIFLAGQIAYNTQILSSGNVTIAQAERSLAVTKEQTQALQQNKQARLAAINLYESRVVGAEGGTAKNPNSTAKGYGQFTEGTYLQYFKQAYGDTGQTRSQILETRDNAGIAKGVLDAFTQANATQLEAFGAKVTAGNLYLAHFLGAAGAKAVLSAAPGTSVQSLVSPEAYAANAQYLRTDNGKGRSKTAGEVQTFIAGRVGDTGVDQTSGQVANNALIDAGIQKQTDFNLLVESQNIDRGQIIDSLTAENGLRDAALTAAQRQEAIEKAIVDLRQKAADANKNRKPGESSVVLSDAQVNATAAAAGNVFDAQHPAQSLVDQRAPLDRSVSDLGAQRSAIQAQMQALQGQGEIGLSDQLKPQLAEVTAQFQAALSASQAFYDSLSDKSDSDLKALGLTRDQVENIKIGLDTAKVSAVDLGSYLGIQFSDVIQKFASGAANAFDTFAKAVGSGKNVFHSLRDAFLQFASSFLQQIAGMIEQQLIFNAISAFAKALGLGATPFGPASSVPLGATASVAHAGGIIGGAGPTTRSVNPAWFADAARFHTGGIVGLAPNEVAAVLLKNEEVLTTADPRHSFNGGRSGTSPAPRAGDIHVVNVSDPVAALKYALGTPAGERVLATHMSDNAIAIRGVLGVQ